MIEDNIGSVLRDHNEKIVQCMLLLKEQRDELAYIIDKQYEERQRLETEMERIAYKLCLINRSLGQRLHAKSSYDKTLAEIEERYNQLVQKSSELLMHVEKEFEQLDSMINKKTNTEDTQNEETGATCCEHCDKSCRMLKEYRSPKSPKKVTQSVIVDVEPPTKLEKTENGSSNVSSNTSSGGNQDADDEDETRCKKTEVKKDVKDESDDDGHSYTLQFQKYS